MEQELVKTVYILAPYYKVPTAPFRRFLDSLNFQLDFDFKLILRVDGDDELSDLEYLKDVQFDYEVLIGENVGLLRGRQIMLRHIMDNNPYRIMMVDPDDILPTNYVQSIKSDDTNLRLRFREYLVDDEYNKLSYGRISRARRGNITAYSIDPKYWKMVSSIPDEIYAELTLKHSNGSTDKLVDGEDNVMTEVFNRLCDIHNRGFLSTHYEYMRLNDSQYNDKLDKTSDISYKSPFMYPRVIRSFASDIIDLIPKYYED